MEFKKGDPVVCTVNYVWGKVPMFITEDKGFLNPYTGVTIRRCKHPTLGLGAFNQNELILLENLSNLEKLIYNIP